MSEGACLIGGAWVPAAAGTLAAVDPSDGSGLGRIARGGAGEIDAAVAVAWAAADGDWGLASAAERGRALAALGRLVEARAEELARLEARDVGKPLTQARADAAALAHYLVFYAGAADKLGGGETIPFLPGYTVYTLREPHGVTGHIIPWNYPMQIVGRSVGAALAAGNACVLKPAEEASLSALAFARLAAEACRRARSTWCRAPAGRRARRWRRIRASIISRSPGRWRWGSGCRRPRRRTWCR